MRRSRLLTGQGFLIMAFLVAIVAAACGGTETQVQTVEVEKIVEKEVIREVVKEVPVTTEVIKEVPVIRTVVATPTAAPVAAKTGTIPGSVLTIALESAGGETTEPRSEIPVYGCRPGCLAIKDDMFLMDPDGRLLPHVVAKWDFGSDTKSWTLTMQEGIKFHNGRAATIDDMVFSLFEGGASRVVGINGAYGTSDYNGGKPRRSAYDSPYSDATRVQAIDATTLEIDFLNPTIALPE
ncbi:MAG: ABC transporter substrate-binding protein, partial [Chloroflexi bacterium]|nr:ABC transporter substrate-binding protein [Chloroflexota bacterium]